jgi:serine/threonine protein kinase
MTGQLGTPAYMANEMLNQRLDAGDKGARLAACDVFSFGVLINAIWSRHRPYEDLKISAFDLLMQVNEGLRTTMADTLPPAMRSLVEQCWHGVPNQRLTFSDVVKALSDERILNPEDDDDSEDDF